jgi:hypothetical protein
LKGRVNFRGRSVRWWQYLAVDENPTIVEVSSSDILSNILHRYGDQLADGRSRKNAINGVIGAALRRRHYLTLGHMIGTTMYQFRNCWDSEIRAMVGDKEFQQFVERRIADVYERDRRSTK